MAKDLTTMTFEELGRLFPIIITEYNQEWPELYQTEKELLVKTLGDEIKRIHHIGSTAVPHMYAKPTIDILIEINENVNTENLKGQLRSIGYHFSPRHDNPPPHMMFMKGYTPEGFKGQAYHVHIRYTGDWDELYFRDYLIAHPGIAREYVQLKLHLQKLFRQDREGYTHGKGEFIREMTRRAREEKSINPEQESWCTGRERQIRSNPIPPKGK